MKKPSVPSWIFTWLPGLISILKKREGKYFNIKCRILIYACCSVATSALCDDLIETWPFVNFWSQRQWCKGSKSDLRNDDINLLFYIKFWLVTAQQRSRLWKSHCRPPVYVTYVSWLAMYICALCMQLMTFSKVLLYIYMSFKLFYSFML